MRIKKLALVSAAILVLMPVLAVAQAAEPAQPAPATATPVEPKADGKMKEMMMGQKHSGAMCPCPNCPMKEGGMAAGDAHCQRMQMIMSAQIAKDDPEAVLGMREALKLTPEQTKQIEAIQAETRAKVAAILSAEQKTELAKLPAEAMSMKEMHKQMMAKMKSDKPAEAAPAAIEKPKVDAAAPAEKIELVK